MNSRCSMPAIWCSSTRPEPVSATCAARTRKRRSSASIKTRSAALAYLLQNENSLDLNGVILLSQILNFDNGPDGPQFNPGMDLPYALALPTYAATAWYHHKLENQPAAIEPFLHEVETF